MEHNTMRMVVRVSINIDLPYSYKTEAINTVISDHREFHIKTATRPQPDCENKTINTTTNQNAFSIPPNLRNFQKSIFGQFGNWIFLESVFLCICCATQIHNHQPLDLIHSMYVIYEFIRALPWNVR